MIVWALGWGSAAVAGGSVLVGPAGEGVPTSDAAQVSIAPDDDGNTIVVTARVAHSDAGVFALLWPAPGIVETSIATVGTTAFERIEAATRPRVERVTCDELIQRDHVHTVPGCSSYDTETPPPLRGEAAVDVLAATGMWADTDLLLERIEPPELEDWLALRGFALDPDVALALEPHLAAGEPILTIQPVRPVADGTWLPPVRFRTAPGDVVLPFAAGDAVGSSRHDLYVLTGAPLDVPNPSIANYPRDYVQDDCILRASDDLESYVAGARAAFEEVQALPAWVLEHAGRADTCAPCTDDVPLDLFGLGQVGIEGQPDETRLGRMWLAWDPGALDEDPVVTFTGLSAEDADLRLLETNPELAFAYPWCGEPDLDPGAERCANIHTPNGGCATAPLGPVGAALACVAWLVRRRRLAAIGLAVLGLGGGAPAHAEDRRVDPGPKTELALTWSLVGTDRVIPTSLDGQSFGAGGPWLLNPFIGIEARRNGITWRTGRNVGVLGGVRGFAGRAAPWGARGVVGFALIEPWVALDARHGRFREANPCLFGRYGLDFSVQTLWSTVSPPQATLSGGLHGGFGAWVGRGTARTAIEARVGVIPRTDGFETTFDDQTGLPGWLFLPGTANLWLVVGRTLY